MTGCTQALWNPLLVLSAQQKIYSVPTNDAPQASVVRVQCWDRILYVTAAHVATILGYQAIAYDAELDVAVLDDGVPGEAFELAEQTPPQGSHVWLLHNPAGMRQSVGFAIVANVGLAEHEVVFSGSGIWLGSSGGAIVDQDGRLVSIVQGAMSAPNAIGFPTILETFAVGPKVEVLREMIERAYPECFSPPEADPRWMLDTAQVQRAVPHQRFVGSVPTEET